MSARHVMIRASAGAGKTYALTSRYVALLAQGAAPERIVALTFTRKAAGEFFDEILNKLAGAAGGEEAAVRLAHEAGCPHLGRTDFRRMLRAVVEAMPRLRLGTLDGFFGRIARAFPLELGLAGEFEILQEHAARLERRRVLQRMFARPPEGTRGRPPGELDRAQREFIEAFKRATFGAEEKRLGARLDAFLDEHHETFLAAPEGDHWGNAARIWPEGCAWIAPTRDGLARATERLRAALAGRDLTEKQRARWTDFFAALPDWSPGSPLPGAVEYLVKNALLVWPEIRRGSAEITVERRKVALGPDECAALVILVSHLFAGELARRLEMTRGIHAVLAAYERVYDETVRRSGKLTFGDVQRLLAPVTLAREAAGPGAAGAGETDLSARRVLIDFRLDAQFDHWLLDEFQDTSFGQWRILENLIDEAVQDPGGTRSFFCVGDVKQAIFTWREGDPRLFREILDRYNRAAPGTIAEVDLVRSFRSGPAVIGMVNAVFGHREAIAGLLPGPAGAAWNQEWRPHVSARPQLAGEAAWLQAGSEEERLALMVEVLRRIAPLERGLECAVLVQSNAAATAVAEHLRRTGGFPAVAESDLRVAVDNPLGAALLALVQLAAHPGDTLAREHVGMTPLAAALAGEGLAAPEAVTEHLLRQIHAEGFARTMEFWIQRSGRDLPPGDAFSRERGRQFVAAAAAFDATGSRDAAEFVAFMQRHTVRSPEVAGVVRVMTIHKSKGLGFDVVVLPDLEGQRIDQRREGLAVQRAADRAVEWVLDLPPKLFAARDEVLQAHLAAGEAEAGYEALALLYVGLTRAKRAMYAITASPGRSESRNYPRLLAAALGDAPWNLGDPRWYETINPNRVEPRRPAAGAAPDIGNWTRAVRRPVFRPSMTAVGVTPAIALLALDGAGGQAAEFGTAVHGLLAEVEWAGARPEAQGRCRRLPEGALEEAMACLDAPALARVWRQPTSGEVWRERAFEIVLEGGWVTGVFDRVVVERAANGGVAVVTVYDFKTDRVEDSAGIDAAVVRHAGQMKLYRQAAAVVAGAPAARVKCELVFTALRQTVEVPCP